MLNNTPSATARLSTALLHASWTTVKKCKLQGFLPYLVTELHASVYLRHLIDK